MPIIEWSDFSGGMDQRPAHGPAKRGVAEEIRNYYPNSHGRLQRRLAIQTAYAVGSVVWSAGHFLLGKTDTYYDTTGHNLWVECTATPLRYSTASTTSEVRNYSGASAVSYDIDTRDQLWCPFIKFEDRVFFGLGANTTKHASWADHTSLTLSGRESYNLGHAAPAAAPSLALVVDVGDLTDTKYYGFAYTYYNDKYGDETVMSAKANIQVGGTGNDDLRVRVTMTQIVDQGFDKCRIYITDAHDSAADAVNGTYQSVGLVSMTNGTSTFTADVDASLLGGSAYSLGAANATIDHDVLGAIPRCLEAMGGILWAVIDGNTLRNCKRTTDKVFVEAWPAGNDFLIGNVGTEITALQALPGRNAMLVFCETAIYIIEGTVQGDYQIRLLNSTIGCLYRRTVETIGSLIYFLADDNRVWVTDGASFSQISDPVGELLKSIPRYQKMLPVSGSHEGNYWLSFPVGVLTTSTAVSHAGVSNIVMTQGSARTLTDGSTWDLSGAILGMYCEDGFNVRTREASWGWITAIDDDNERITYEGQENNFGTGKVNIVANNRIVVYNTHEDWWTQYRDLGINQFMWMREKTEIGGGAEDGNFMGFRSTTSPQLVGLGDDDYWDQSATGNVYITGYFLSEPIDFKDPSIVRRIYVHFTADSSTSIVAGLKLNGEATASVTKTFTPSESSRFSMGIFGRCRQVQLELSWTPTVANKAKEIERIGMEYTPIPTTR
jgi:hypothetical protein